MTGSTAADPAQLTAAEAARRIAAGELTSETLVGACLERIAAREDLVRAWAHLDPDAALGQARERDAQPPRGPLHGVPVGVKDIVDTAALPTERGSPIHAGRRPDRDAACVARLHAAGAVVLGKTVTTEFAYFRPGPTRNPADPVRTPGGSSSGSAAAVADGMVPVAIGSQTAGSVIRPAAFCGVPGFKPTHGSVDLTGVMGLSPALDTLGWFARDVADLALLGGVLADGWRDPPDPPAPPRFAVARTPWWERAEEDSRRAVESTASRLEGRGAEVRAVALPPAFAGLPEAQNELMAYDVARSLAWERDEHGDELSDVLRELIDTGRALSDDVAGAASALAAECRAELRDLLAPGEALLVPAVVGEPPPIAAGGTGDPWFCRPWTLLGTPAVALPAGTGAHGAPVGVQLVAPAGQDGALLAAAAWASAAGPDRVSRFPG